ncbi:hypothetical protein F8M41_007680 [Gigaspora margarita]|uniref:Uncharacterized protein n=1 Tax=Gigaspora margarita TaxID=4874 RepID=A0A8H4A4A9_GIGMA|nr:hypothetical protein F8M41_007680 [Gigaspora margarita]
MSERDKRINFNELSIYSHLLLTASIVTTLLFIYYSMKLFFKLLKDIIHLIINNKYIRGKREIIEPIEIKSQKVLRNLQDR